MPSSRYFVTNLPVDTKEDELRDLFKDYGTVSLVDLKSKENALEPGEVNVFAFVTVEISQEDAEYYLNELKWTKLRGAKIRISLAKESFLERLKRERAENESAGAREQDTTETPRTNDSFLESSQNTRRVFGEDDDGDADISADLLITKKRAARSIRNGKIVIEESGERPLHVIEKQKKLKHAPVEQKLAEQKRKESLNKMKNQYEQKKNLIKDALSGVNKPQSTKIKFSDAEEDDDEAETKTKSNIFGSDNEDDENINDLKINYGKKGDKLAKLKSENPSLDPRFRIDEKFVDEDGEETAEVDLNEKKEDDDDNETDERNWQLNILEQVVGYKLDKTTTAQKAAKNKKMVRFDPSKTEHQKLLRQKTSDNTTKSYLAKEDNEEHTKPVSQEVFYVVSDTLTEALKTRGEGFSLLNMFGSQAANNELEQREDDLKKLKDERILVNKQNKNTTSAAKYESSSSGEDDEEITTKKPNDSIEAFKNKTQKGKKSKVAIMVETFFFSKNDERLKEGALFFQYDKLDKIAEEDYEPVRRKLNSLIKKKITKTRRNQIGAGKKGKRNKKKL